REEHVLEAVEDRTHLRRPHALLVVVQQRVVELVGRREALHVPALELDELLEPRTEPIEVGGLTGLDPHRERTRARPGDLGRQLRGNAYGFVVVATDDADAARFERRAVETLLLRKQLLQHRAGLLRDQRLARDRAADRRPTR